MLRLFFSLLLIIVQVPVCHAKENLLDREDVKSFLNEMADKHGFSRKELISVFSRVELSESVLKAISRPAEKLPWYRYRPIFLQPERIRKGVEFWHENKTVLERAEGIYGVPVEIIVAIIGVETRYGKTAGSYKVINSLATLAFEYPDRSVFFKKELEQFLLLAREQGFDPLKVMGSYAGAMGIPQFIASSYRNYAVDFDNDGVINIWSDPDDAIGSVANYFKLHGWTHGGDIAVPAEVKGNLFMQMLNEDLKPDVPAADLRNYGISHETRLPPDALVKLLSFETKNGHEYWLGFKNFYVITRYNHSPLYAMAVYQLAQEIRTRYNLRVSQEGG